MTQTATADDLDTLVIASIVGTLGQAAIELDRLWLMAAVEGKDEALQFAEASQAVHRALVALST